MHIWMMDVDKRIKYAPLLLEMNHEWSYGEAHWNMPPKTTRDIYLRTGKEVSPWFDFRPMRQTCKKMDRFDTHTFTLLSGEW